MFTHSNVYSQMKKCQICGITYAANGAIFSANACEMQYPAPPVANQNCDDDGLL